MMNNKPSKLLSRRRSSPQTLPKRKPNQNKNKNPLHECSNTITPAALSIEAPKGCLSFLLSNSSKTNPPKSKSLSKTPKQTPLPSKTGTSSHSQTRSKPPSKNRPVKPNPQRPFSARDPQSEDHRAHGTGKPLDLNSRVTVVDDNNNNNNNTPISKLVYGSRLISTPESSEHLTPPVQASISPEIHCTSEFKSTPASTCFGAGHVVAKISDKRKCRPRGILTVGGDGNLQVLEDPTFSVSVVPVPAEASVQWLVSPGDAKGHSPPIVVVSGFEGVPSTPKGTLQQSSPCSSKGTGASGFGSFQSGNNGSQHFGFYTPPRSDLQNLGHYTFGSEGTPSSLVLGLSGSSMGSLKVHQQADTLNPSVGIKGIPGDNVSGSSPCSLVSKGTPSSGSKLHLPRREDKGSGYDERTGYRHRYNLANENSPCSGGSSSRRNVICTPRSDSSFDGLLKFRLETEGNSDHRFDLGSMSEVLCNGSSPMKNGMDILPLPDLNFEFPCPSMPLNSDDETRFLENFLNQSSECRFRSGLKQNKFGFDEFCREEKRIRSPACSEVSQMRISWRDGLVSRIFEMDELDCCKWLWEEEEGIDYCENEPDFSHDLDLDINSSALTGKYLQSSNAFGSFEFLCEDQGDKNNSEVKHPHLGTISCAESISTEGGGLAVSGDSDWTICYRNQLFEEPV